MFTYVSISIKCTMHCTYIIYCLFIHDIQTYSWRGLHIMWGAPTSNSDRVAEATGL